MSISYPKEAIRAECLIDGELKGFGQLHPRSQGVETLGKHALVWINSFTVTVAHLRHCFAPRSHHPSLNVSTDIPLLFTKTMMPNFARGFFWVLQEPYTAHRFFLIEHQLEGFCS